MLALEQRLWREQKISQPTRTMLQRSSGTFSKNGVKVSKKGWSGDIPEIELSNVAITTFAFPTSSSFEERKATMQLHLDLKNCHYGSNASQKMNLEYRSRVHVSPAVDDCRREVEEMVGS